MESDLKSLHKPLFIGTQKIKNRIGMAPMGGNTGLIDSNNAYNQNAIEFYKERARGGVGLIVTGFTRVEDVIESGPRSMSANVASSPFVFTYMANELTEAVHVYGTKIFLQLSIGFGAAGIYPFIDSHPVSASAVPNFWNKKITCRELSTTEVETFIRKTADAALIAKQSGFDGVEIHALHQGYLLDQFALKMYNRRTDKYGGELEDRLRFATDIVAGIKEKCGAEYPVIMRYSVKSFIKDWHQGALPGEKFIEKGRDLEEGLEVAKILEKAGYDALDSDCASHEGLYWAHPPCYSEHGLYLPYVSKLKDVVNIPVMTAGRMDIPHLAAEAVQQGKIDMVMLGRALLADPWWPHKVEHGNVDDIRPCIACHDGCIARCDGGKVVSCTVNPQACRETQFVLQKSEIPKKIAVVGGGMAGMEAARVSAIRGHEVTLFEKGTRLGGRVHEASVPDFKEDERRLFSWYEKQLRDLAIDVKLNTLFTDTLALNDGYDKILYAGGAKPCFASTEVNGFKTVEASEFLLSFDESDPAKEYLIVGAGLVGCEIAIWLSKKGKKVTLVEQKEQKGMVLEDSGLFYSNIQMINDLLRFYEVKIFCQHYMLKAEDGKVTIISNDFKQKTLSADKVIFAVGYKVDDAEYEKIKAIHQDVYKLGDAKKVGNFLSAIWDGFLIAKDI